MVYEDLHWVDKATEEYLLFTDDSIPGSQAYQAARETIDRVQGSLENTGLRRSLESAPLIREVYDLSRRV